MRVPHATPSHREPHAASERIRQLQEGIFEEILAEKATAQALRHEQPEPSPQTRQLRVGFHGASGKLAQLLLRMLWDHPRTSLRFLSSSQQVGQVWVSARPGVPSMPVVHAAQVDLSHIDLLVVCSSDPLTDDLIQRCLRSHGRVIDVSKHLLDPCPLQWADVAYGLTELSRGQISEADIVVNPGSHSTCIGLALAPLGSAGQLQSQVDIQNCSGHDLTPPMPRYTEQVEQEVEALKSFFEEELLDPCEGSPRLSLESPQTPTNRALRLAFLAGVEDLTAREVHELYQDFYLQDPFIRVLPWGSQALTDRVLGTNHAEISIHPQEGSSRVMLLVAIDPLVKGVAGQTLQNLNVMFHMAEDTGICS